MIRAFSLLFGFATAHVLLETSRDALFLARLPASRLPWVYLAIAILALVLFDRLPTLLRGVHRSHELVYWLRVATIVTFILWAILSSSRPWTFYALYIWTGVLATLFIVRFWIVIGSTFTVTQAKRAYTVIGAGAVAGGIVGAALAALLSLVFPARHLVLAAAAAFALTSLIPAADKADAESSEGGPPAGSRLLDAVGLVVAKPYLQRVGAVLLLGAITFTLVDFVFKSVVDRTVPAAQLDTFFALTYLGLNSLSLLIQLSVAAWLIRRLGVTRAMAVVPALLLTTGLGVAAGGGLILALLLKAVDGSFRYSLHRTGSELLFVPLAPHVRDRVKPVLDVIGQRGGQAVASLIILLLLAISSSDAVFAALVAVAATVWLMLALDLRRHYLDVFRTSLTDEITAARWDLPELDVPGLEALLKSLDDGDERRVVSAMELMAAYGKTTLIPTMILRSSQDRVVVRATELLAADHRKQAASSIRLLLGSDRSLVRSAAVRALSALQPEERVFQPLLRDPDARVRAAALAALAAEPGSDHQLEDLHHLAASGTKEERLELARGMRARPTPQFTPVLLAMIGGSDDAIRAEAILAISPLRVLEAVPELLDALAERPLRAAARTALVNLGISALPRINAALADPSLRHDVRRQLPEVIAAFGTAPAAGLLVERLQDEEDGMIRFKILRALGRMRRQRPTLPLDTRILRGERERAVGVAGKFLALRRSLSEETDGDAALRGMLEGLLRDKQAHALERIFRLLNLESGNEDFFRIFRGLQSSRRETRAGARELLEHLVQGEDRGAVLLLIDDLYEPTYRDTPTIREINGSSVETTITELRTSGSQSIRELAVAFERSRAR